MCQVIILINNPVSSQHFLFRSQPAPAVQCEVVGRRGVSYAVSSLFHYSVAFPPPLTSCCFGSHVKVTEVNGSVWKYFNWLVTGTVVSSLDFEAINCFLLVHCFMGSLEISLSRDLSSFNSQDNGEV